MRAQPLDGGVGGLHLLAVPVGRSGCHFIVAERTQKVISSFTIAGSGLPRGGRADDEGFAGSGVSRVARPRSSPAKKGRSQLGQGAMIFLILVIASAILHGFGARDRPVPFAPDPDEDPAEDRPARALASPTLIRAWMRWSWMACSTSCVTFGEWELTAELLPVAMDQALLGLDQDLSATDESFQPPQADLSNACGMVADSGRSVREPRAHRGPPRHCKYPPSRMPRRSRLDRPAARSHGSASCSLRG
jgi:hypothetical protein